MTTLRKERGARCREHHPEQTVKGNIRMSSIITLEIRAAEGGDDPKLFVGELAKAYERLAETKR